MTITLPENPIIQSSRPPKQPISVLVLLHDNNGNVLLLERADRRNYWQSVTGSLEVGETPFQAALREVAEETGLILPAEHICDWQHQIVYEIFPHWRHRYAEGVTHNTEHWFSAQLPHKQMVQLAANEHTAQQWLPAIQAAEMVFSPSNRDIILQWYQCYLAEISH